MSGSDLLICPGVVPVLVGPLQVLLTVLPGLLVALAGGIVALFKPSGIKNLVKLLWQQKIAVTLLVLIVAGAVYGYRTYWPDWSNMDAGEVQAGSDWSTARFDLRRCGAVPGTPSPTVPRLIWSYNKDGFLSTPTVVGNRVFVASYNATAFNQNGTGRIYCFDADTGAEVWTNAPEGYRATFSSPVVVGNYLYCGEGTHKTADARIICLDIRPEKKGEVVWTFATENHVECTPVVADGRVYVGAGDDGIYCLDVKPGPDGKGRVIWHQPTEKFPDAETSLAVYKGKVYVGLGREKPKVNDEDPPYGALCVLDGATGAELHRLKMPYPVFSPPAIADGKLYVGMGNGDYYKSEKGGEVRCLDLATLELDWTFELEQTVLGAIAVKEDKLYFCSKDGHLYCVNRKGKLQNKFNAHAPIATSAAVTDQAVYFVSEAGLLFAIDRFTLEPLWEAFRVGVGGLNNYFVCSPTVARGHVYVGSQLDGFMCIGVPDEAKMEVPTWEFPLGGPGKAGNSDDSFIPGSPSVWWQFPADAGESKEPVVMESVAALEKELFAIVRRGPFQGLVCLPGGSTQRSVPEPRWRFRSKEMVGGNYVVAKIQGRQVHVWIGGAETILNRSDGKILSGEDPSKFKPELFGSIAPPLSASNNSLRVDFHLSISHGGGSTNTEMHSFCRACDRETGTVLWEKPWDDFFFPLTPFCTRNNFLQANRDGLRAFSLIDGSDLGWKNDGGPVSAEFAVRDQQVIYVNYKGELIVADRKNGKVQARVPGCRPGIPPLVSRGQAVVATEMGLGLIDVRQEEPTLEMWLADVRPIAPMVLMDSCVYVPTQDRGLVCIGGTRAP